MTDKIMTASELEAATERWDEIREAAKVSKEAATAKLDEILKEQGDERESN